MNRPDGRSSKCRISRRRQTESNNSCKLNEVYHMTQLHAILMIQKRAKAAKVVAINYEEWPRSGYIESLNRRTKHSFQLPGEYWTFAFGSLKILDIAHEHHNLNRDTKNNPVRNCALGPWKNRRYFNITISDPGNFHFLTNLLIRLFHNCQNRDVNFALTLIQLNADTRTHTLFTDCSNTRPYTSTISTSCSKQQHETYLQLDCCLAESNAPAKHPFRSTAAARSVPCPKPQAERASHEQTSQQWAEEPIFVAYMMVIAQVILYARIITFRIPFSLRTLYFTIKQQQQQLHDGYSSSHTICQDYYFQNSFLGENTMFYY